jgi:hypothetical protein
VGFVYTPVHKSRINPKTEEGQAMRRKSRSAQALSLIIAILTAMLIVPGMVKAGSLEPTAGPGPTMKTLDEIPPTWSQKLPAAQRFMIVLDGAAVLDKETGLVWEKSPDATKRTWLDAIYYCYTKTVGGRKGWRLPTIEELASLIDATRSNPALPSGHPFLNVQSSFYWSSTTYADDTDDAWLVTLYSGNVLGGNKTNPSYVWPVRGGQGR